MKATMKELDSLHGLIAGYYKECIESGEDLSSGTLAAINTFLKNNDVKMEVMESTPGQNLTFKLQSLIEASAVKEA